MKDNAKLFTITIEHTRRTIEILYKWEADICTNHPQGTIWLPANHLIFKYHADVPLKNLKLNWRIGLLLSAPLVFQQSECALYRR